MELLAQRYELRKQIGAGGMATVWEAWGTRLHRTVAVKLLARSLSIDPAFVTRFEREARHAAHLNCCGSLKFPTLSITEIPHP